ncbi:MAG: PAS domain S-box protein [Cytophaga sp.]|uniref:PAS domain S-box protein n=1 Tax=Cytophaga sp. TaxID=29535 RepID=UPI003F7D5B38
MEFTEDQTLFQIVFDSAANGIAAMQPIYDASGKVDDFSVLLFNKYILQWVGDIDYKGKRYTEIFPMARQNDVLGKFIEAAETGITTSFERMYEVAGSNHWFRFTATYQAGLLIVTLENITEPKQTELALHKALEHAEKQERLYNSITNNTPDLVYVFDLQYRFTYANKALLAMWGKSAEDAIGRGLRENGYEEWHAQMHEREIDEIIVTKKPFRGTVSFPHAELGRRIYDYILVPVLNGKGEVEAIAGTTRDITDIKRVEEELKRSEARFRNMLQEAPVAATLFMGPDLVIEIANELTQQYWWKSKDIIGKPLAEAAPELEEQQMISLLKDLYQRGGAASYSESPITFRKNDALKEGYYNFSIKTLHDNDGRVEGILSLGVDVTEQVRARKQIEASEARLKSMIDQTPAPTLVLMGDDLAIEQVNAPMLQLLGRGDDVLGIPLLTLMPELKGQYIWEQVEKVYREGTAFDQSEVLVPHERNGILQDYYYNIAYRPLKEDGQITGMIQVAIDVTEQVTARKKLEESETRFRALVNASSDVVYRMNADWSEMRELEGRGFLADTGEAMPDWAVKYIHPKDYEKVQQAVADAVSGKYVFELEHRVLKADGTIGWTFSRAVPIFDQQNNIIEWFGSAADITAQKEVQAIIKESEEKFSQMADLVPQIIWTGKADGYVDYFNKRWYEYTGSKENLGGDQSWIHVLHPDDAPMVTENWYNSVVNGMPYQLEFRIKNGSTGEYRWFLSKALPIRDKTGIITKWFGTCTDIHEQKTLTTRLESLVAARTKELQRSNEDLQQFAHVASHDLKEPVRKIKTFTGRLEDQLQGKLDEPATRYIEKIQAATDRIYTMIDGVLAYSTINANKQKSEEVDLNVVLKNIEADLEIPLQKNGGTIQYHNLPTLEGAPVLLNQLFYNLINNSIKFAKADVPPQILVSSETIAAGHISLFRITVQDNGIGFDAEMADQIFETFTRLNSKDKYEGTGLGLSLCKKIVERHNGSIVATGSKGVGATFVITLPMKQKAAGI